MFEQTQRKQKAEKIFIIIVSSVNVKSSGRRLMQDAQNLSPSLEHKVRNHSYFPQLHAVLLTGILFIFAALGIRQRGLVVKLNSVTLTQIRAIRKFKS